MCKTHLTAYSKCTGGLLDIRKKCEDFKKHGHCESFKKRPDETIPGKCSTACEKDPDFHEKEKARKAQKAAKANEKDPQSHKREKDQPPKVQNAPKADQKDTQLHKREKEQPPNVQKTPKANEKDPKSHTRKKEQPSQAQKTPKANQKEPQSRKREKKQPSQAREVPKEDQKALVQQKAKRETAFQADSKKSRRTEQVRARKDERFNVEREETAEYIHEAEEAADIEAAEYEARRREMARASNPPPARKVTARTIPNPKQAEQAAPAPTRHPHGHRTPKVPNNAPGNTYPYPAPPTAFPSQHRDPFQATYQAPMAQGNSYLQLPPYPTNAPQGYTPQQTPPYAAGYPINAPHGRSNSYGQAYQPPRRKEEPAGWDDMVPD